MIVELKPVEIESSVGGIRSLWDWSVTCQNKTLSGMENSEFVAKFYIMIACIRFLYTKLGEQ